MTRGGVLARWAIVGGATALGGGCALIVGFPDRTLASTEGTGGASASSGGGAGGASASSGGEGGHGGAVTTSTTSTSSSVASSSNSGVVAASSSSGGTPTYCQSLLLQPVFCDDFEGASLTPTWNAQFFANGAMTLTTAQAVPFPGQSVVANYMGGGVPANNLGRIFKDFPTSYASMHLGFDMFVDQLPAGQITYVAELDLDNGYGTLLYIFPGGANLPQRSPGPTFGNELSTGKNLPTQTWMHVDIALALVDGGTSTVTMKIDGAKILDAQKLLGGFAPGKPTITLGDVMITSPEPRSIYYDNVVFDAP